MTPRHRLLTLALIAALSSSLTACGGGSDPETKPSPNDTTSMEDPAPATTPARPAALQPAGKTSSPASR